MIFLMQIFFSQIFPQYSSAKRPAPKNSALTKIKERRECKKKEVFATVKTNSALMSPAECGWLLQLSTYYIYRFMNISLTLSTILIMES